MGRDDLQQTPDLPPEITDSGLNGDLVIFVGAGISQLAGLPSWSDLAERILFSLQQENALNFSEIEQMRTLDPRKKLSIASLLSSKPLYYYIRKHLVPNNNISEVYRYLNRIGCAYITTNYDELLVPQSTVYSDNKNSPASVKRIIGSDRFYASHLNTPGTVIHLHGSAFVPSSLVVTTKEYLEYYDKEEVKHLLRELFAKKTVLFVGYGLEEAEILEHILRRGDAGKTRKATPKLFVLQGFFSEQKPLYTKLIYYYDQSFGVYLIGYNRDFKNYQQQEDIIKMWSEKIVVHPPSSEEDLSFMDEVLNAQP